MYFDPRTIAHPDYEFRNGQKCGGCMEQRSSSHHISAATGEGEGLQVEQGPASVNMLSIAEVSGLIAAAVIIGTIHHRLLRV